MYNLPTSLPNKLKKSAPNPFVGNGGSSQQITTDASGKTGVTNPMQQRFSPASERTFDMAQYQKQQQAQHFKQQSPQAQMNQLKRMKGL